ncbi:hypothetical protein JKP88DRAFT_301630 [Tribonema minus]|uniref:Uncharacterized protein n=1 Tax=Tribonema minus TaxID=303371 RepID=A0A836CKF5_9STRA|nr:hypothetical protein JKP88DRAFT_301630 [Tribonema minus]
MATPASWLVGGGGDARPCRKGKPPQRLQDAIAEEAENWTPLHEAVQPQSKLSWSKRQQLDHAATVAPTAAEARALGEGLVDARGISDASQQADVHRAIISAKLAAAGPDDTVTLVPHYTKEGAGRIAYFLKRAEAIEFIRKNQDSFGGVPPCMDTVRAAALGQLYDGVDPLKVLLDARQGGYAIATRSALRGDGSCSPEVVLGLRLELQRRGGGGSGTEFVCTWAEIQRFQQFGDGPQSQCVFGPIEEVLCGEPGATVPLHRIRDGLQTRGSGAVVGRTAGSKAVKATRRDAAEPVERSTAYGDLSTDQLVTKAALRCAYTVKGTTVAAAQQRVRVELEARLLPDDDGRITPRKLKVGFARLEDEALAIAAHTEQDWVVLPGGVEWCPRAGCTRRWRPRRLLVAESRVGELSAPAGYTLETSRGGDVKHTTIDLETWCRAVVSQEWCGPLFNAATRFFFRMASDGSVDRSWQQEEAGDGMGSEPVCIRELVRQLLLHGVVDLHPREKRDDGVECEVIYRRGGEVDTSTAERSRNEERHLRFICAVYAKQTVSVCGIAANWVEGADVPAQHLERVRTIVKAIAALDEALRGLTLTAVPGETGVYHLSTATNQRATPEVYIAVLAAAGSSAFKTHLGSRRGGYKSSRDCLDHCWQARVIGHVTEPLEVELWHFRLQDMSLRSSRVLSPLLASLGARQTLLNMHFYPPSVSMGDSCRDRVSMHRVYLPCWAHRVRVLQLGSQTECEYLLAHRVWALKAAGEY